jgi:hypothetical protein
MLEKTLMASIHCLPFLLMIVSQYPLTILVLTVKKLRMS